MGFFGWALGLVAILGGGCVHDITASEERRHHLTNIPLDQLEEISIERPDFTSFPLSVKKVYVMATDLAGFPFHEASVRIYENDAHDLLARHEDWATFVPKNRIAVIKVGINVADVPYCLPLAIKRAGNRRIVKPFDDSLRGNCEYFLPATYQDEAKTGAKPTL